MKRREMQAHRITVVNCGMEPVKVATLLNSLVANISDIRIDAYEGPHAFLQVLRRPGKAYGVVIFMLADRYDLACLQVNKACFSGIKTIVVITKGLHDLIPGVHQLSPRYIAYEDDGIKDVVAILGHMVQPNRSVAKTLRKSGCSALT